MDILETIVNAVIEHPDFQDSVSSAAKDEVGDKDFGDEIDEAVKEAVNEAVSDAGINGLQDEIDDLKNTISKLEEAIEELLEHNVYRKGEIFDIQARLLRIPIIKRYFA